MVSTLIRLLGTFLLVNVFACQSDPRSLTWTIDFEQANDRTRAAIVRSQILRGGCDGSVIYTADIRPNMRASAPPALLPGRYGISATAIDTNCKTYALDCKELPLPLESSEIKLTMIPIVEMILCPLSSCNAGACTGHSGDGGM